MYGEGQRGRTGVGARSAEVPEAGQQGDTEVWNRVKRRLRAELGEDVFTSWFARLELDAVNDGCAHLTVPTRFLKSWIEAHYADRVRSVYRSESPLVANIAVAVRSSAAKEPPAAARPHLHPARADTGPNDHARVKLVSDRDLGPTPARSQGPDTTELGGAPLDPRLSFASFIVGRSNALAHAAADRVARHQGTQALYNPLYLHAGVGLGKTHLLHAIGHEARRNGRRVIYLTADRFMYGFVAALKAQTALAFKERLRGIDLLILDDVQFIQGRSIQQEFGHTLNSLIDSGRQIVVASDRPPTELESLDERVRSRLGGGLVVEIGALDEQLRASILAARVSTVKMTHAGFDVGPAVISYVARAIIANGRDLEGAVNRLLAHATLTGSAITLETAEIAIRDLIRN
ncbi:MAG TPA: chromosomal replication initiator protein DnaA, partial [Beijerinckiaceae bacterium]|nr:chromosomal replication initiator protein DnaA [Beijerinckiaceae bacterium]